jgi:hypothetical protein
MTNIWINELLYVAVSRVSDEKLLTLYNAPRDKKDVYKLRENRTVKDYLENGVFEQFGF